MNGWWARLRRDRRGVAALEFALLSPVLIVFIFGTVELVNVMRVKLKLNAAAAQLAEMIATSGNVTMASANGPGGTLGDMCTAASYNMAPYSLTPLYGYIESSYANSNGTGQYWASDSACPSSYQYGSFNETIMLTAIADTPRSLFTTDGTPHASGGTLQAGTTAVSLELIYSYQSVSPLFLGATLNLVAVAAVRPRSNVAVTCTYPSGSGTASCPGVY